MYYIYKGAILESSSRCGYILQTHHSQNTESRPESFIYDGIYNWAEYDINKKKEKNTRLML